MSATDTNTPEDTTPQETTTPESEKTEDGLVAGTAEESKDEAPKEETPHEPLTAEAITLPEGAELAEGVMDEFLGLANELKLSPEAAQKLVDLQAKTQTDAAEKLSSYWKEEQEKWRGESLEFLGTNKDKTLGKISQVVDEYGGPEVTEALTLTGAGNHPAVVKMMAKIADALVQEGEPISGEPTTVPGDRATRIFPNMN